MPAARAAASTLAWRAAGAVVAAGGSRSVLLTGHAQRLAREAAFLLVFGQRPAIRSALLETLQAGSAGWQRLSEAVGLILGMAEEGAR